jgi:mannan endo-1,4-beta-mannosidase
MNRRKKYTLSSILLLVVLCANCSPSSDSLHEDDIPQVIIESPEDGEKNILVNTELVWEKVDEATEYEVQISDDSTFTNLIIDQYVESNTIVLNQLEFNTIYYWRVRALVNETRGPWSEIFYFTTVPESDPPTPTQTTLKSPADNSVQQPLNITFKWTLVANANNYRIQIATDSNFKNVFLEDVVDETTYRVEDFEPGQSYYWRVLIIDGDSETGWSDIWKFTTETSPSSSDDFVSVLNNNFIVDGNRFRFAGTNAYYLPNYEKLDPGFVTNTLNVFEESGIKVIRMWAFYDGYDCGYSQQDASENVIQTAPGEYSELALQDLDNVIAKGKNRGIRFILTFINYWDDLGGICQYNTWDGASNPSTNMDHFLNSSNTQKWFKNYINMLLNRVNTATGVAYKNEPAIFAWEIMNEARYSGQDPSLLRDWYQEIAVYIKSIDGNHLVSTGEEGFDEGTPSEYSVNQYSNTYVLRANEGTSYIMNTAIPEIDFGGAHWYPSDWGFGHSFSQNLINAQHAWLSDHQQIAADLGKPFILGEYGYAGWGNQAVLDIYDDFWNHSEEINLDGNLLWQFTTNYVKCYEFGGNICWPDGRQDTNLYNSFKDHIENIKTSD